MNELFSVISSGCDANEKLLAVKSFNENHDKKSKFCEDENDAETKQKLLQEMISLIDGENSDSLLALELLRCIRILCRENISLDPLREDEALNVIIKKSNLGSDFSDNDSICGPDACKCFVNICVQNISHPEAFTTYQELNLPQYCVDALKNENLPEAYHFPIIRFFLQLTGRNEEILSFVKQQTLIPDLCRIVKEIYRRHDEVEIRLTIVDIMSLLFIMSQHLGPLEGSNDPNEEELQAFKSIVPVLQYLLSLPKNNPESLSLISAALKCMINIPAQTTDDFQHHKTLEDILEFLIVNLQKPEDALDAASLTPVLLIMSSISKAISEARVIIKDALLPGWREYEPMNNMIDPPEPLQDENSLGYKLLFCMTTANTGLSHYSAELIFQLCGEDSDEFVRIVGIGKAAGLLANRGLLGNFASRINQPTIPQNVTEEDVREWEKLMERLESHNRKQQK